ncbi:hypothetical protein GN244_ATG15994 [Phytophthora infestans]|uniref:RxLR effector protein n=1 Tax=Phytophthora infestans TaxID=4787 RepID=A0A833RSI9_PHYIN|nr:hypothetical protein GN244_ATG15994 [Phytophthora infestans]
MRFYSVLLTIVTLIASTYDAKVNASGIQAIAVSSISHDAPAARMLRADHADERGISVPSASKIVEWMLSPKVAKELTFLENRKVQKWVDKQKTQEYVFTKLGLNSGLDKALSNPKLHVYAAYIDRFNVKNPSNKVALLDKFSEKYTDEGVAKMVEMGIRSSNLETENFASRLWRELLNKWMDNAESAEGVFKILKLDEVGGGIFATPLFNTWYTFIKEGYTRQAEDIVLRVLSDRYGYDGLSRIFFRGQRNFDLVGDLPIKLETRMVNNWLNKDVSPDKVFKLLKLDEGLDKLLTNSNMQVWESYMMKYNLMPDVEPTTMMQTITRFYNFKELSSMLENAKMVPELNKVAERWQHELRVHYLRAPKMKKEG